MFKSKKIKFTIEDFNDSNIGLTGALMAVDFANGLITKNPAIKSFKQEDFYKIAKWSKDQKTLCDALNRRLK
jgi:hypothetical protein